jgi:hypothetical protein
LEDFKQKTFNPSLNANQEHYSRENGAHYNERYQRGYENSAGSRGRNGEREIERTIFEKKIMKRESGEDAEQELVKHERE